MTDATTAENRSEVGGAAEKNKRNRPADAGTVPVGISSLHGTSVEELKAIIAKLCFGSCAEDHDDARVD